MTMAVRPFEIAIRDGSAKLHQSGLHAFCTQMPKSDVRDGN